MGAFEALGMLLVVTLLFHYLGFVFTLSCFTLQLTTLAFVPNCMLQAFTQWRVYHDGVTQCVTLPLVSFVQCYVFEIYLHGCMNL